MIRHHQEFIACAVMCVSLWGTVALLKFVEIHERVERWRAELHAELTEDGIILCGRVE